MVSLGKTASLGEPVSIGNEYKSKKMYIKRIKIEENGNKRVKIEENGNISNEIRRKCK